MENSPFERKLESLFNESVSCSCNGSCIIYAAEIRSEALQWQGLTDHIENLMIIFWIKLRIAYFIGGCYIKLYTYLGTLGIKCQDDYMFGWLPLICISILLIQDYLATIQRRDTIFSPTQSVANILCSHVRYQLVFGNDYTCTIIVIISSNTSFMSITWIHRMIYHNNHLKDSHVIQNQTTKMLTW